LPVFCIQIVDDRCDGGSSMTVPYPRDMVGYGATPLEARWPGDARIALQFVINYEEGGENAIFHGDPAAEAFLSEWIGAQPVLGMRNMNMESLFEYGSRAGFWRLHRAFTSRKVPVTVYGIAMALERNPDAVAGMLAADWENAGSLIGAKSRPARSSSLISARGPMTTPRPSSAAWIAK
jgi:peptidoglycan/xylan/chitin deacetylase (PgdA/CDA1 family)